jgi:hypothetical protein
MFIAASVRATHKQNHSERREIALTRRLPSHYRPDEAAGVRAAGDHDGAIENAFDWLTDGVVLLRLADGDIVYANDRCLHLGIAGMVSALSAGPSSLLGQHAWLEALFGDLAILRQVSN